MNILETLKDIIDGILYRKPEYFDGTLESIEQKRLVTNKETIISIVVGAMVIMFTVNLHGKTGVFIRHVEKLFKRFSPLSTNTGEHRPFLFNYNKRKRILTYSFNDGADMGVIGALIYAILANVDTQDATSLTNWLKDNRRYLTNSYSQESRKTTSDKMRDALSETTIYCYHENKAISKYSFMYNGSVRSIPFNLHALALINGAFHGKKNGNNELHVDATYINDLYEYWESVPDTDCIDLTNELNTPAFTIRKPKYNQFPETILCHRTYTDMTSNNEETTEEASYA